MAKKYYKAPLHQTGMAVTTKTHFGSTIDMVIDHTKYKYTEDNKPVMINEDTKMVVCKDDRGFYMTPKNRINSGLADPNRYANQNMRINIIEVQENDSST